MTSTFSHIARNYFATEVSCGQRIHHIDYRYAHLLAQELNNRACDLIFKRKCEEAIDLLTRAVDITEMNLSTNSFLADMTPCTCHNCRLEKCFMVTEREECFTNLDNDCDIQRGNFLCSNPLFVCQSIMSRGHYMGARLSMIILFNLALAHQLKAIMMSSTDISGVKRRNDTLQNALDLYELSMQLNKECAEGDDLSMQMYDHNSCTKHDHQRDYGSNIRFSIMVMNNISEIHRVAGNVTKRTLCVEHLLMSMMSVTHGGPWILNGHTDHEHRLFTRNEIDGIFRNIQSSLLMSNSFQGAAAA